MADDLTPQDAMNQTPDDAEMAAMPAPEAATADAGGRTGFFSTTAGKVTIIVIALFAFMIVAGMALGAFLLFFAGEAVDEISQGVSGSVTTTATASAEATEGAPIEPSPVALSNIYTFRNIFSPLIEVPVDEAELEEETEDEVPDLEPNTLFLQDIVVEDGNTLAVLVWNGQRFELEEGEMITGTPWQVLSIGSNSVTMLFGDEQVVLIVGQGIVTDAPVTTPPPTDK